MSAFRRAIAGLAVFGLAAGLAVGQDVVAAAKKEKERRQGVKPGAAKVITNADLAKARKTPAMEAKPAEEGSITYEQPVKPNVAPPSAVPAPKATADGTAAATDESVPFDQKKAELSAAYEKAQERAELLDLKMRALNQQLFTFNSMSTKDQIQKAIAETYKKLQDAQSEATKAKADLEKLINANASAQQPPIWIK